jgi:hypothetical protein
LNHLLCLQFARVAQTSESFRENVKGWIGNIDPRNSADREYADEADRPRAESRKSKWPRADPVTAIPVTAIDMSRI